MSNIRVKSASKTSKSEIAWRSHEPSRLETYSDAVFAFAVTLIIVSLEVPKSFNELYETMKGTVSFAACFAILFNVWNKQNLFFRRYGLNDKLTVSLNGMLLFVVLIYAYPLKFLFGMLFLDNLFVKSGHAQILISDRDVPTLMTIYGAGFTGINALFALMYYNAKRHAAQLKLTDREMFHTNSQMGSNIISSSIGVIATVLVWVLPLAYAGYSGFFYFSLAFVFTIWFGYRKRKHKKLFGD